MMRLIFGSCVLMALTACGSDAAQPISGAEPPIADAPDAREIRVDDMSTSTDTLPEGLTLPANTQIASNMRITMANGEGAVIRLDSTAEPAVLEDHFRLEARAAGFVVTAVSDQNGVRQWQGERADGMQFDFAVTIDGDGITRASLAIGREDQR